VGPVVIQYWPTAIALLGDWEPGWPQMLVFVDGLQFSNFYPEEDLLYPRYVNGPQVRSSQKEGESV
jgi:hypothetical protein